MTIQKIDLHPENNFTFSSAVVAGDFIYTAHTGGVYDDNGTVLNTIEEQTEQTFRNLEKTLAAAGATLNDVVRVLVVLRTIDDFAAMRDVYRRQFTDGYPARMTITSELIDAECLILVDAVAYKPR